MRADELLYANVFLSELDEVALGALLEFAPVPSSMRGFVTQHAEVIISNAPLGAYVVADAHTDPTKGAVSFGSGTLGASPDWLPLPRGSEGRGRAGAR